MVTEDPRRQLRGRRDECEALDRLASQVEAGQSAALVLRGEAGIGKSALLDHLVARAAGQRIARVAGAESEMELPFAGLHQLCAPFLGRVGALPAPQREALATAFGLSSGPPPDRFLVGLAVLSLLADAAAERPLFCLVDDAQWLDRVSAQTLAFVARRMFAEPLALVLAFRDFPGQEDFAGLPELRVEGLDAADARALLDAESRGPVDDRVRDRILAEARGNPLALVELPHALIETELIETEPLEGFGLPAPGPVAGRVEQSYLQRVHALPDGTRRLLLVAAAEPVGDVALLRRAAGLLAIEPDADGPAVAAGLIDVGTRVRFRHPLLRSAVYRSAGFAERRAAHRALAEATDPGLDPDRRAWHLARSAVRPDEAVAAELASSGGRAQARGGAAASAAFLARAAVLTPDPRRKAERAVAAAGAKLRAGAPTAARELLTLATRGPLDELDRARVDLLHAQIAFASSRGRQASPLLLAAARRLVPLDANLARETFLDAISAAMFAGRLAGGSDVRVAAEAAREALPGPEPEQAQPPAPAPAPDDGPEPRLAELLLTALALRFTEGHEAAVGASRETVRALLRDADAEDVLRWSWLVSALAADVWDDEGWRALVARHVRTARAVGALGELPLALNAQVVVLTYAGELDAAALLVSEIPRVQEAAGGRLVPYGALSLAAWRGDEVSADALIRSTLADAAERGEGIGVTIAHRARAVLCNGLGRYEQALDAARRASAHPQDLAGAGWGLTELVEAAVRAGDRAAASDALDRLARTSQGAGTDWSAGVLARARALLAEGDAAEELYRESIRRLGATGVRAELARSHLVYGEWLRRENRRVDAREQLRLAHDLFTGFGAEAFAERAVRELRATGETVARRTGVTATALTAQEEQIARLARDGLTNAEIGAQLFLSPHTVEWHLRKVFAKLGITSRRRLHAALAGQEPAAGV